MIMNNYHGTIWFCKANFIVFSGFRSKCLFANPSKISITNNQRTMPMIKKMPKPFDFDDFIMHFKTFVIAISNNAAQ